MNLGITQLLMKTQTALSIFSGKVAISAAWYNELLEARIQRDMLLNIAKNVASYNVADYIKNVFGINLKEDD